MFDSKKELRMLPHSLPWNLPFDNLWSFSWPIWIIVNMNILNLVFLIFKLSCGHGMKPDRKFYEYLKSAIIRTWNYVHPMFRNYNQCSHYWTRWFHFPVSGMSCWVENQHLYWLLEEMLRKKRFFVFFFNSGQF